MSAQTPSVQIGILEENSALLTAGDVNGDGFEDIVIAAPEYADKGRVYLYDGAVDGPCTVPDWTFDVTSGLSMVLKGAGDFDGDGFADLVFGLPSLYSPRFTLGTALVFLGSPYGPRSSPTWTMPSVLDVEHLGRSVSTAGDVNRDGLADIVIGAPYSDVGNSQDAGVAVAYYGRR